MKKYFICAVVISAIIFSSASLVFSQDPQGPAKNDTAVAPAQQEAAPQTAVSSPAETAGKQSELSIYGEVQVVNVQAASISVQYYDYDNDEEKTIEVSLDKDSKLENVKTIVEIKKGDWVDVVYVVTGGKNVARSISVEKEEPAAEENTPIETAE